METDNSLNRSIDDAKKHYSSLFFLPSFKIVLLVVAALCFVIGLFTLAVFPSMRGLTGGLLLGLSFFALTIFADLLVSKVLLKADSIFVLRRTLVLSLFGLVFWLLFIIIGVGLAFPFGWLLWVKLSLLGYAVVITLRIVVLVATSTVASWKRGVSVLLQPTLCLIALVVFWSSVSSAIPLQALPFIVLSPIISFVAVFVFFHSLESFSMKISPMGSIPLFRAFIINWVTDQNAPLEKFLEKMGEDSDIEINLLKFESSKPKAAIIVPFVHPGPFKNIGSSLLPSLLKSEFEKEFRCETCVPLGLLGHELDLASQEQNRKIVSHVIASAKFKASADLASPLVRSTQGTATASCQIFGDTVFLSFTLAPKTTEDLPQELGRIVSEEAAKFGLKYAMVVNTHNSIDEIVDTEEHLVELQVAASKCLQKAVEQAKNPFMIGGASVFPKEFSLKDGMGTGGITALVVEVENQKTAYVIIDGNNMVPGLREKIIDSLSSIGFGESEVFTTDTHAVSALITGGRGYHPVGEVMDTEVLIRHIIEATKKAETNLETSTAGFLRFVVPQVRVIGEARLKSMTTLVHTGIQKAKQILVPIFGLEGLVLVLLLLFLIR